MFNFILQSTNEKNGEWPTVTSFSILHFQSSLRELYVLEALSCSFAVKALKLDLAALVSIHGLTEIGQILALKAHAAVAQRDVVRAAHQEARRGDLLDALIVARAQIVQAALPLALAAERYLHAVEQHILDVIALTAGEEHAVLTVAGDIGEADVRDLAARHALIALVSGEHDGLGCSPPAVREAAGFDDDIRKRNVLRVAAVAHLDRDAAVAVRDDAVIDDDVLKIAGALGADLECGRGRSERAAGNDDIPARAVLHVASRTLQADAVIGASNVAADDANIGGMIRVDAVRIGAVERIEHADALNEHIVAARRMQGPERCVLHGDAGERDVLAVLHIAHGRARIEVTVEVIRADALHERIHVAVDSALTGDGEVVRILGVEERIARLERYRAIDRRRAGYRGLTGLHAVRMEIGADVGVGLQHSPLLQMQLDVALEHDGAGIIGVAAFQHNTAAAGLVAGINGRLNGRCVIGRAIAFGAEVKYVILHPWDSPSCSNTLNYFYYTI